MSRDRNTAADQQAAEADVERFRDQLGPFVVAAEKTRMPMLFTNAQKTENPIVFANDADSALALLEAERFDVAILDVNLGDQASFRVAEALALRSIPFVFSTGYGEHRIEGRFRDRPVLRKPYSEQQLGAAVASLLSAEPGLLR